VKFGISLSSPSSLKVVRSVWSLIRNFQEPEGILRYVQRARFSRKPIAPRYVSVFDVRIIFDFLSSRGSYVGASFEELRLRVILLLRLDLLCRSADLECVHWGAISVSSGEEQRTLRVGFCKNKVWRAGKPVYVWRHVAPFIRDEFDDWRRYALSAPHVVTHYLNLAASFVPDPVQCFLLKLDGSGSLSTERIASIARDAMSEAGIDTSVFKPHSLRTAAATKAYYLGTPIRVICTRGNWASEEVFVKWYIKEMGGVEPLPSNPLLSLEAALRRPCRQVFSGMRCL